MELTEVFVVRIYRRYRCNTKRIAGLVELVSKGRVQKFESYEELHAILKGCDLPGGAGKRKRRGIDS
jgi:hypothetical protein